MMIKNTFTRTNKKRTTLGHCIEQTEADQRLGAPARELTQYPHRGSKLHKQPPHCLV